ncbi:hypothetical protein DESPIGER_0940 [Desulfovibrio piger]|uniref:Uncharacterized protein n=1 Tax=Desulfovibrio piger TaxID=901 RepID=A0A1K1LDL5_9BACT|nr:hypothetical protein DESPIGER_0940 [Desulfovibrio piger]
MPKTLFKRVSAGNKLSCTALKRCKCRINVCCPSRSWRTSRRKD